MASPEAFTTLPAAVEDFAAGDPHRHRKKQRKKEKKILNINPSGIHINDFRPKLIRWNQLTEHENV